GDFITLCFDPIVNFISKSVAMYGRRNPMPVVVRCPVGGNRGYGPTHSQNMQKHFLGVPHLSLYELSPFHDPYPVFEAMLGSGEPAICCEDTVLYGQPARLTGTVDGLCTATPAGGGWVRVGIGGDAPDRVIVAPGGLAPRVLAAMRTAVLEDELDCELTVP